VTATEQLAALDAKVTEARGRYEKALDTFRRGDQFGAARDVLTPLFEYARGVEARTREESADELRQLTADACERIVEGGLVFHVPQPGQVTIGDPSLGDEVDAARDALTKATNERDQFAADSRDEREAERKKAEADQIKDALAGDDPDTIREALSGPQGDGPLTSADLKRERKVTWHV
jgi:hypothetical protein